MTRAVESGMPKLRIEEAAARRQARIDRGEDVIVGVNKFQPEDELESRRARGRQHRGARLAGRAARADQANARRDARRADAGGARRRAAESGKGNLLELSIEAARARATVGEISSALEKVWGRHRAETKSISGVYGSYYARDPEWERCRARSRASTQRHGRRPRLLVVKMGQDGHDRGAKVIATAFADARLRRRRRSAVSNPGRSRAPGGRKRRPRDRSLDARPRGTPRSCPR